MDFFPKAVLSTMHCMHGERETETYACQKVTTGTRVIWDEYGANVWVSQCRDCQLHHDAHLSRISFLFESVSPKDKSMSTPQSYRNRGPLRLRMYRLSTGLTFNPGYHALLKMSRP